VNWILELLWIAVCSRDINSHRLLFVADSSPVTYYGAPHGPCRLAQREVGGGGTTSGRHAISLSSIAYDKPFVWPRLPKTFMSSERSTLRGSYHDVEVYSSMPCLPWQIPASYRYSYGLDGRGSIPSREKRCLCTPQRQERLWDSPILLSSGYRVLFPWRKSGRGLKLTAHLHLVPRSRKCGLIHPLPHTPSWRSA
jgi:hypothetical protein